MIYTDAGRQIPEYVIKATQCGECGALMPLYPFSRGGAEQIEYSCDGKLSLKDKLSERHPGCLDSYECLLDCLFKLCEGIAQSESFLVDHKYISLKPDDIYFTDKVCLLAKPPLPGEEEERDMHFCARLLGLCGVIQDMSPSSRADYIAEKLREEKSGAMLSPQELCRFLARTRSALYTAPAGYSREGSSFSETAL